MSNFTRPNNGYLGNSPAGPTYDTMVIGERAYRIHNVVVHTFNMGDVDDPDIYAAAPLFDWERSEAGSWVMSHAIESPTWHRYADPMSYGYKYAITAKLKDVDYTFWTLKWASTGDSNTKS